MGWLMGRGSDFVLLVGMATRILRTRRLPLVLFLFIISSFLEGFTQTTVYSVVLSGTGVTGYNTPVAYREFIPASELTTVVGNRIRVTMFLGSGSSGANITHAYVGSASGSGPNYTGDQVQLFWGGSSTLPAGTTGSYTSDWVTFAYTGQAIIFSCDFFSTGDPRVAPNATGPNLEKYWYENPQLNDAGTTVMGTSVVGSPVQYFVNEIDTGNDFPSVNPRSGLKVPFDGVQ
jgi:hypothetical protein